MSEEKLRTPLSHGRDAGREYHCRGRVSRDEEVARPTEKGEGDHWKEQRVESGDDGNSSDAGIAHRLGNVHRGQGNPGEDLRKDPCALQGKDPRNQAGETVAKRGGHFLGREV